MAPLAAAAAAHRKEFTWADLTPSLAFMHADGLKTARHAQAAGLKVADIYCVMLIGAYAPSLLFTDGVGVHTTVNAKGIAR